MSQDEMMIRSMSTGLGAMDGQDSLLVPGSSGCIRRANDAIIFPEGSRDPKPSYPPKNSPLNHIVDGMASARPLALYAECPPINDRL